jgi:opacity protein-like surface antigen
MIFAACMLFLSFTTSVIAQETTERPPFKRVEFGFRYMPTLSAFEMQTSSGGTVKGEATFGHGIGGMLAFNFTNHFGIQGELIYNSLSQKYKDQDLDREINVRYINIPLMFSINTGKANPVNLNLVVGPQLGFNLGSSIKRDGGTDTDTFTYVLATKKNDIGFAYGAGFEFMLNEIRTIRMDLGFRGVHGLMNINNKEINETEGSVFIIDGAKVRTKSLYIGFSFLF